MTHKEVEYVFTRCYPHKPSLATAFIRPPTSSITPAMNYCSPKRPAPTCRRWNAAPLTQLGAVNVATGEFTGRSPKDKYIVRDDTTRDTVWWSDNGTGKNDNQPLSPEVWQHLKNAGGQPALRQAFVRGGRVLRRQRRHAPESALHHRGGLAGALREKHVYPPERRRTGGLRAGLRGDERRQMHQPGLAAARGCIRRTSSPST